MSDSFTNKNIRILLFFGIINVIIIYSLAMLILEKSFKTSRMLVYILNNYHMPYNFVEVKHIRE